MEAQITASFSETFNDSAEQQIIEMAAAELTENMTVQLIKDMRVALMKEIATRVEHVLVKVLADPLNQARQHGKAADTPPKTLQDVIIEHTRTWLTERVNERSAANDYRDSFVPRAQHFVKVEARKAVEENFKKTIADAVKSLEAEMKRDLKARLRKAGCDIAGVEELPGK